MFCSTDSLQNNCASSVIMKVTMIRIYCNKNRYLDRKTCGMSVITACIRRMGEGYIFTLCVSPHPLLEQQCENVLRGKRYASCVHAGGLSCLSLCWTYTTSVLHLTMGPSDSSMSVTILLTFFNQRKDTITMMPTQAFKLKIIFMEAT